MLYVIILGVEFQVQIKLDIGLFLIYKGLYYVEKEVRNEGKEVNNGLVEGCVIVKSIYFFSKE